MDKELLRFCNRFKDKSTTEIILSVENSADKQPNDEFFAGVLIDHNLVNRSPGYLARAKILVKALINNDSVAKENLAKILKQIEIGLNK